MTKATLFVGTYTRVEGHVPEGRGQGIYSFSLDLETGALTRLGVTSDVGINPTFLTGTQTTLYAANECAEPSASDASASTGYVASFAICCAPDGVTPDGVLVETSRQETCGDYPCHVALNASQDFLVATNYGGGSAALFPVSPADGSLSPCSDLRAFPGAGSMGIPDRQEAAHIHSSVWVPGSDALLAADLGNDRVAQFQLDREAQKLAPHAAGAFAARPAASGPRHLAIHPTLPVVYVLDELDNAIGVHPLKDGALAPAVQEISTIPEGFTDWTLAADIHTSACGKFVLASNRGHDSIAVFKLVDAATGALELLERVPTRGKTPRAFLVVGDLVVVANQDSHSLQVFRFDSDTGKLSFSGHAADCDSPVSIFLVPQ